LPELADGDFDKLVEAYKQAQAQEKIEGQQTPPPADE
jgi:hypothetical protein